MMNKRYLWAFLTLIVFAFVGSVVLPDEPVDGRVGRAEVRFLEGMIDHHQMALDMANDCLSKATTESVVTICQNVITAQTREIQIMRGWLLSWYGIEYAPTSMLHTEHETEQSSSDMMQNGMGMMGEGDMMDMMNTMSDMMAQMSGMMEMMSSMMGENGMMQNGMGMMGGNRTASTSSPLDTTSVSSILNVLALLSTVSVGDLLTFAAETDPTTPLLDVFTSSIESETFALDLTTVPAALGELTYGDWAAMAAELHNLTLADIQEMQGHLENGANVTLLTMMIHHMDAMVSSGAVDTDDHESHHPDETPETTDATDHSQHQSGATTDSDHGAHQGGGGTGVLTDPSMTMGMFAGLNRLTGVDYEIAWLEAMIDHHDDALHMANRILEAAPEGMGHEQIRELAQRIITDQTAEIEAMETLIVELGS